MAEKQDQGHNPLAALRESDDKSDLGSALAEFLTIYADQDATFQVSIFEVDDSPGGDKKVAYVKGWKSCSIPEYEDIAQLGPGYYKIQLVYTPRDGDKKTTSTSVHVRISPKYVAQQIPQVPAVQAPQQLDPLSGDGSPLVLLMQMQRETTQQMMLMMGQFMQTIGGVMMQREKTKSSDYAGIQQMMGDIVMNNVEQQQQLVERLLGTKYGVPFGQQEPEAEEPLTLFSFIKDMFAQYGDVLLKAGPTMQKMFRKQFQESEDAGLIEENPDLYIAAYQDLVRDNPDNQGKLDRILEILGAPNPGQLVEQNQIDDSGAVEGGAE